MCTQVMSAVPAREMERREHVYDKTMQNEYTPTRRAATSTALQVH